MFQLILPFQLELPFDRTEPAPAASARPPRVRRSPVRSRAGALLLEEARAAVGDVADK